MRGRQHAETACCQEKPPPWTGGVRAFREPVNTGAPRGESDRLHRRRYGRETSGPGAVRLKELSSQRRSVKGVLSPFSAVFADQAYLSCASGSTKFEIKEGIGMKGFQSRLPAALGGRTAVRQRHHRRYGDGLAEGGDHLLYP